MTTTEQVGDSLERVCKGQSESIRGTLLLQLAKTILVLE